MSTPGPSPLAARMRPFGTTIFTEMSALAIQYGAINLGQGFPDTDGPPEVTEAAVAAIRDGHNQYPPLPGDPVPAGGDRRPPAPLLAAGLRPGHRDPGHGRGHRGTDRRHPRPV